MLDINHLLVERQKKRFMVKDGNLLFSRLLLTLHSALITFFFPVFSIAKTGQVVVNREKPLVVRPAHLTIKSAGNPHRPWQRGMWVLGFEFLVGENGKALPA
jgi:hypothetical protein